MAPTTPSPTPVQHSDSSEQTNQQDNPKDKPTDTQGGDQEDRWEDPEGEFELSPSTSAAGADVKDQGAPGGGREQVVKYESKDATVDQSAVKRGKSGSPQKKKVAIKSAGPVSTRQKRSKSGSPLRPAEVMGPPAPPAAPGQMVVYKGGPPTSPASKQPELKKKKTEMERVTEAMGAMGVHVLPTEFAGVRLTPPGESVVRFMMARLSVPFQELECRAVDLQRKGLFTSTDDVLVLWSRQLNSWVKTARDISSSTPHTG